jgi:2-iminobutanoate/2-iminopropanoate deaminase
LSRRVITVPGLSHGTQPISIAVAGGGLLVTGGIGGVDRQSGSRPVELEQEVTNVFANVRAVLDAAECSASDVLKLTFFVSERSTRDAINREWLAMFPDESDRPTRHTLVTELAGQRVQAEMIAVDSRSAT